METEQTKDPLTVIQAADQMSDPIPTPRTDAKAKLLHAWSGLAEGQGEVGCWLVSLNDARELERALIEMTKERDELKACAPSKELEEIYDAVARSNRDLTDERDSLLLQRDGAIKAREEALNHVWSVAKERDAAIARAEKLAKSNHETELELCRVSEVARLRLEQNDALRVRLSELEKDQERLDWLDGKRAGSEFNDRLGAFTVQRYQQVCGCIGEGRTLREAIDAAMKGEAR